MRDRGFVLARLCFFLALANLPGFYRLARQIPAAMHNRQDQHAVGPMTVDDAVALEYKLTDITLVDGFRTFLPMSGKSRSRSVVRTMRSMKRVA